MISVRFFGTKAYYTGFECSGHAEYADPGMDIVCSAVSALTINAANSLEQFTQDVLSVEEGGEGGYLRVELEEPVSEEAQLLLNSLALGLHMIEETYGREHLCITLEDI